MVTDSTPVELIYTICAFAIIGVLHTTTIVVKYVCRSLAEMVEDVDDCRLKCRTSYARLQSTEQGEDQLIAKRRTVKVSTFHPEFGDTLTTTHLISDERQNLLRARPRVN